MNDTVLPNQEDMGFLSKLRQAFSGSTQPTEAAPQEVNPFAQAEEPKAQGAGTADAQVNAKSQEAPVISEIPEAFKKYAASRNFAEGLQFDEDTISDPQKVVAAINKVSQQAYSQAMFDTAKMIDKVLNQRFSDYDAQLDGRIRGLSASAVQMDKAAQQLPLLKEAAFAPVVTQVMNGFLKQGKSPEEATALTKTYLQSFSDKVSSKDAVAAKRREDLDDLFSGLL